MSLGTFLKDRAISGIGVSTDPALRGFPGADGTIIRYGATAPTGAVGNDGDAYINTTTNMLHGPKAGGAWPAGVSLASTVPGPTGKSAYQAWLDAGNSGDVNAFLNSLKATGGGGVDVTAVPTTTTLSNAATSTVVVVEGGVAKQITAANWIAQNGATLAQLNAAGAIAGANLFSLMQDGTNEVKSTIDDLYTYLVNRMTAAGLFSAGAGASTPVPGQVTGLVAGAVTSTTQDLAWSATSGATSYKVEKSAAGANTWATAATPTTNSATMSGLMPSTSYDWRVSAVNGTGTGTPSATVTKSTLAASAQAITVNTPATQTVGTPYNVTGTYANGTPAALDYSIDGGATWTAATSPTISGGTFSFSVTPATASAARTMMVRDHTTLVSGTSGTYVVNAAVGGTAYTINKYSGTGIKPTIDASALPANQVYASRKCILPAGQQDSTIYWTMSPNTASSAKSGWVPAGTIPDDAFWNPTGTNPNSSGDASINCGVTMTHPSAWGNDSRLWVMVGSGTTSWDYYIKPIDGAAQKMGTTTVTGA